MPESVVNNGADWSANVQLKSSKKSSCLSTIAIYGFYITVPIIIILLWTLLWMIAQQHATQERASLCLTPECIQISSTILERIDQSINPCDDFYQFSCGNFIRTNEVPDDYYARNLLQKMQESMFVEMKHNLERQLTNETGNNIKDEPIYIRQIKSLYESCVNDTDDMIGMNDPIESLSELIIELIGSHWPLVPSEESAILPASGSGSNSFEYKLALLFLYQVHPFFQVYVIRDKNTSTYALHIFPGSPVMDQLNFVSPKSLDNLSDDQVNLYMNFQREIVKTFLISKNENDTNDEQRIEIERELLNMIKLEIDLANITKDASFENSNCSMSTSNNGTETYDSELCDDRDVETNHFIRLSFDQMEEEFPRIKWKEFFKFALKDANVSATYVLTQTKEYFHSLMAIMERANDRTLINYMGWSIIAKYMPYMGSQFKHLSSELQQKILIMDGDNEVTNRFKYYQSRWKQCVYIACESLKIPSNVLYLDGHQTNLTNTVEDIIKLIEEMKMIFVQIIDTQSWIESDDIKRILKDRIRSIKSNIGVQEYIKNHTLIESMYESLDVQSDKELITNMFNINKHETILQVKKLNSEAKFDGDILFQPLEANAFYDFSTNSISTLSMERNVYNLPIEFYFILLHHIVMPIGIMRSPLVYHNIPK
ncbi:hypothetical protein RDWZM_005789 [Blomia tropicalis]|uniref:Peptidase M13 N-terminal domain-containing protein n=1 Tax=Blomia tropicalis TaxID=40697 RepID=A0A9Q0M928_BLOTA|nr:hypothetical protein RDWZM_005789 [Blomia tropicalis]